MAYLSGGKFLAEVPIFRHPEKDEDERPPPGLPVLDRFIGETKGFILSPRSAPHSILIAQAHEPSKPLKVGDKAPPWGGLRDQRGQTLLRLDFQNDPSTKSVGKIVVFSFFQVSCEPCIKELPMLLEFAKAHKEKGVEVILVGLREDEDALNAFVQEKQIEILVTNDYYGVTAGRYGVSPLPHLFVIGRDGRILGIVKGKNNRLGDRLKEIAKGHL